METPMSPPFDEDSRSSLESHRPPQNNNVSLFKEVRISGETDQQQKRFYDDDNYVVTPMTSHLLYNGDIDDTSYIRPVSASVLYEPPSLPSSFSLFNGVDGSARGFINNGTDNSFITTSNNNISSNNDLRIRDGANQPMVERRTPLTANDFIIDDRFANQSAFFAPSSFLLHTSAGANSPFDGSSGLDSYLASTSSRRPPPPPSNYSSTTNRDTYRWIEPMVHFTTRHRNDLPELRYRPRFEDETTSRATYIAHPILPADTINNGESAARRSAFSSGASDEFLRRAVFETETTNRAVYTPKKLVRRGQPDPPIPNLRIVALRQPLPPFDATTTSRDAYRLFTIADPDLTTVGRCPAARALAIRERAKLRDGHYFFTRKQLRVEEKQ